MIDMSTPKFFDVHTHTQFAAFNEDADIVIQRALDAGVWMINVGTQKDTSIKAIELAYKYLEGVYAAVGLHPVHTEKSYHDAKELGGFPESGEGGFTSRGEEFDPKFYRKLSQDSKVVAIGECGLDYYRLGSETKEKQKKVFLQQIELAEEVKKPLMIHCRQAFSDLISILQTTSYKLQPSIVHFFSGTKDDAKKLLDLGFSFSFGGVITFAREYDEVIQYIPLARITFETDAPYVAPIPFRGKRNEPLHVIEVVKKIAELKNFSVEEAAQKTTENARLLFGV